QGRDRHTLAAFRHDRDVHARARREGLRPRRQSLRRAEVDAEGRAGDQPRERDDAAARVHPADRAQVGAEVEIETAGGDQSLDIAARVAEVDDEDRLVTAAVVVRAVELVDGDGRDVAERLQGVLDVRLAGVARQLTGELDLIVRVRISEPERPGVSGNDDRLFG